MFSCDSFEARGSQSAFAKVPCGQTTYKFVSLMQGDKNSIFNTMECVALGHELVAVASLQAKEGKQNVDADSLMFQTWGSCIVPLQAQCLGVPCFTEELKGKPLNQQLFYAKTSEDDEVEDLYRLLESVKQKHPDLQAVASGPITNNYQRLRMENVCKRLGLMSLTYLWNRDQHSLMQQMIKFGVEANVIKTAAKGSGPAGGINTLESLEYYLNTLKAKFGHNVCGESGEYETAVTDCPLFKNHKIVYKAAGVSSRLSNNSPVSYGYFGLDPTMKDHGESLALVAKSASDQEADEALMEELVYRRKNMTYEFLYCNPPAMPQRESMQKALRKQSSTTSNGLSKLFEPRITLSVSILNPELTQEDIKAIPQKEQMIQILDYAKAQGFLNRCMKVSLLVSDMSQFKPLNDEYVKYFMELDTNGLRPPVRSCVSIPSDEVIASFMVKHEDTGDFKDKMTTSSDGLVENHHVQGLSYWAPPNVGPYSQLNKLHNVMLLAGCVGLYPPALKLTDPADIQAQYLQAKDNLNKILSVAVRGAKLQPTWQQTATSALIFIGKSSDISIIMDDIIQDYAFIDQETCIVRVPVLPIGALIEIEHTCDSVLAGEETAQTYKVGCKQRTYKSVEDFAARAQESNPYGEVFYDMNLVTKEQVIASIAGYDPKKGGPAVIPAMELINPFDQKSKTLIVERFYDQF